MQVANGNNNSLIKKYALKIGQLEIYPNYAVAELNEGITLNEDSVAEMVSITHLHYANTPFAYITIRKNSYAVDPIMYLKIFEIENLKAIAIVSTKSLDNHNIKIERHFFKKPMNIFSSFKEALTWAKSYL